MVEAVGGSEPPAWMRTRKRGSGVTLVVSVIVTAFAALIAGANVPSPHTAGLVFANGELAAIRGALALAVGLPVGAIAWAITYFAFVQPSRSGSPWLFLIVLLGVALADASLAVWFISAPHQRIEDVRTVNDFAVRYHQRIALDTHAYGAAEAMLGPAPLTSEGLAADPTLGKARQYVEHARAIVVQYQAIQVGRYNTARAQIGALPLSPAQRQLLVAAFDRAAVSNKPAYDTYWSLETRAIDEEAEILRQLLAARGAWSVRDGRVFITSPALLNRLEASRAKISAMAAESQANLFRLDTAPVFKWAPAQPGQQGSLGGRI